MDTTTKNKMICTFMGITYYESYAACRDTKLRLHEEASLSGKTAEERRDMADYIDTTHKFSPEYHYSYDDMIPVVVRLRLSIHDTFGFCDFLSSFIQKVERAIWLGSKLVLFNLLCETINHFNQLTKNKSDAGTTQQIQQPDQAVQSRTHTGSDGSGTSNGTTGIPQR